MLALRYAQLKIFYAVIAGVLIAMVDDFFRQQIAPQVLLHDQPMFKQIFRARFFLSRADGIRVPLGRQHQDIAIFADLAAPFPGWVALSCASIHRIGCARESFAIHGILGA